MHLLVAQRGARRNYAVPAAFSSLRQLDRLVTDFWAASPPWTWISAVWPERFRPDPVRRMLSRCTASIPERRVWTVGYGSFLKTAESGRGAHAADRWVRGNSRFCRAVVRSGLGAAQAVYAFNGAAKEIFEAARAASKRTILDQTAAPWRWNTRMLAGEVQRWPDWEVHPADLDVSGRMSEREEQEWRLADRIICGSEFVVRTLGECGGPVDRCAVVPYPIHIPAERRPLDRRGRGPRDRVHALFVGTLQLRKGVQYLWEAQRLLRSEVLQFRMVGPSALTPAAMTRLRSVFDVVGPVPRSRMDAEYAWADVVVLPTLSEGSANVIAEALARGIPVITTPNAGSVVSDGHGGLLVPSGDPAAVASALERFCTDRALRDSLRASTVEVARRYDFDAYAASLTKAIAS